MPEPTSRVSPPSTEVPAGMPSGGRSLADRVRSLAHGVPRLSAWPLRAKLVASMLALFTVLSLATGAVTVAALTQHLDAQVDEQLVAALHTPPRRGPDNDPDGGPGADRLQVVLTSVAEQGWIESGGSREGLTSKQLQLVKEVGIRPTGTTIDLGNGEGRYRVMAASVTFRNQDTGVILPGTYVVGLSTGPTDATVARMVVIAVTTIGAGVLLVAGLGTWLVRRNLEPLRRVAATATKVSQMPLHSGQVALAERVPPEYTDTRTEVGQVGAAFNEMLEHVDEALNARHQSEQRVRQFVADASHELRTPLASIKGYAELTRREPAAVPSSVNHAMDRIESEAGRMSALVEDLLLLARLDAGRPLDRTPVDLSMLVVDAVSDAHAAAPDHRWGLDLPPEPIEVTGDRAGLHQIVANLLGNARTHTPPGTTVTTSVRSEGDTVRIAVHDNGPGVPDNLKANVFERFARGDDARNRSGGSTGLGLSIVSAVTKAHGGRVELDSRPGDTTFSLVLPSGQPA